MNCTTLSGIVMSALLPALCDAQIPDVKDLRLEPPAANGSSGTRIAYLEISLVPDPSPPTATVDSGAGPAAGAPAEVPPGPGFHAKYERVRSLGAGTMGVDGPGGRAGGQLHVGAAQDHLCAAVGARDHGRRAVRLVRQHLHAAAPHEARAASVGERGALDRAQAALAARPAPRCRHDAA